jgi:hypothetical protein
VGLRRDRSALRVVALVAFGFLTAANTESVVAVEKRQLSDAERKTHVRPMDAYSKQLLADGARRSATFADLVVGVERSRVVVYISAEQTLALSGSLGFMADTDWVTYLRVHIRRPPWPEQPPIATLAHELRHALEVAAAPQRVTDGRAMKALYAEIGFRVGIDAMDSDAARATEVQVQRELAHELAGQLPGRD